MLVAFYQLAGKPRVLIKGTCQSAPVEERVGRAGSRAAGQAQGQPPPTPGELGSWNGPLQSFPMGRRWPGHLP